MKRSRRELSIDMVVQGDIFKNNQIMLFPRFTPPKTKVSFYWAVDLNSRQAAYVQRCPCLSCGRKVELKVEN